MTTRLDGPTTRFLPVQPRQRRRARATRPTRPGIAPATCGRRSGRATPGWTSSRRFVHVIPGERRHRPPARSGRDDLPPVPPVGRRPPLEADARADGAGRSYLVQHCAGSGKSNTIAWLAHRLMSPPRDRRQAGVRQGGRHHRPGHPRPPAPGDHLPVRARRPASSRRSTQTRPSSPTRSPGEQARIVITTLQKFPFILDKVAELGKRRFAVIVDEAHSSQTGEAAKDLKAALGATRRRSQLAARGGGGCGRGAGRPAGRPRRAGGRARAGSRTCRSSPSPPRRRPAPWSCSAGRNQDGQLRAVPPVLDAPGDRGGVHPRRARELHDLRDLLEGGQGGRATTPSTTPEGQARDRPVRLAPPPQPRPEGRDHRRALPPSTPPQDRRQGQGDGRHRRPGSTPSATSRPSTSTSPRRATSTPGRWSRSPARSTTTASTTPSRR